VLFSSVEFPIFARGRCEHFPASYIAPFPKLNTIMPPSIAADMFAGSSSAAETLMGNLLRTEVGAETATTAQCRARIEADVRRTAKLDLVRCH